MLTPIVSDLEPAVKLQATPMLAARRARDVAELHAAVCRWRRAALVCSTCCDLTARAARLEANRG